MSSSSDREALLHAAANFCNAFACQYSPDAILSHFSTSTTTSEEPFALEHGLPSLAPFLGRRFTGPSGIRSYFSLLSQYLSYTDMRFVEYVVDVEAAKVVARGTARFTWKASGQSWDEVFVYVLGFGWEGEGEGEWKVRSYEVWADSGAVWLASRGGLG